MSTQDQALWAQRTGQNTYTAHSSTGGSFTVAPAGTPDSFTPSDLLSLALATCNLMSADKVIARRLGDDFTASVAAQTEKVDGENRYGTGTVEMVLNLSELSDEDRSSLEEIITKAVHRGCTVGRTLDAGMPHTLNIVSEV